MEFEKYIKLGQEVGLEGSELVQFARDREAIADRQQREKTEREERRLEREDRQKQRIHEQEVKAYELRIVEEQRPSAPPLTHSTFRGSHSAKIPKLPVYNDQSDDLDAYLRRFEQFAELSGWPEDEWGMALSALLKGKSLEVYSRLPADKAKYFNEIKAALLNRFRLTEEGFRLKFRTSKRETGERFTQFADRLKGYLERWIELGDTKKTYDHVVDLFISEQILEVAERDLVLFIKERKPKLLSSLTEMADQYLEAHLWGKKTDPPKSKTNQRPQQTNPSSSKENPHVTRRCYECGKMGHISLNCRSKGHADSKLKSVKPRVGGMEVSSQVSKGSTQTGAACMEVEVKPCTEASLDRTSTATGKALPLISAACTLEQSMPVRQGVVGNQPVTVLRDTGCSTVVVRRDIVTDGQLGGRVQPCVLLDGTVRRVPVACIKVDTPFFSGKIEALCMDNPLYDLIIGNITGARSPQEPDDKWHPPVRRAVTSETSETVFEEEKPGGAVETRAMKSKKERAFKPLLVAKSDGKTVSREEISSAQQRDSTLTKLWRHVDKQEPPRMSGNVNVSQFVNSNGLLCREFQSPKVDQGRVVKQLIVPQEYRDRVLMLVHDSPLAGHLGVKKMTDKLLMNFYWPGVTSDVQRFCRSGDICQRTVAKGKVGKVSLGEMPLIDTPFKRIAVDLVGPIHPMSERGNRYILVIVDYATRYPEAVALPRIEAERVAEALLEVYTRLGITQEVLTDMGTQFTSEVMREVGRLLTIKQLTTTPYHPICNGLVERFNATLKKMLRRMCAERPKDWDRFLPALLFAYREAPQESLGFSPFELMYGRSVRGPLSILRDIWTGEHIDEEVKTTYQYVIDLRERLQSTCELAREELAKATKRYQKYYNVKAKDRHFKTDDRVLILRPTDHSKLLMQWAGPYPVVRQVAKHDYVIQVADKERTYHANLLKLYVERGEKDEVSTVSALGFAGVGLIEEDPDDTDGLLEVVLPPVVAKEGFENVHIEESLSDKQYAKVQQIIQQNQSILSDIPGKTHMIEHTVHLTSDVPMRSRAYPVPHATREVVKAEIESMMKLGVIEQSESPYASPIVLVRKSDGSNRFCIDYRRLNAITVFDPEPIPNADDLMARLGKTKFLLKVGPGQRVLADSHS